MSDVVHSLLLSLLVINERRSWFVPVSDLVHKNLSDVKKVIGINADE